MQELFASIEILESSLPPVWLCHSILFKDIPWYYTDFPVYLKFISQAPYHEMHWFGGYVAEIHMCLLIQVIKYLSISSGLFWFSEFSELFA